MQNIPQNDTKRQVKLELRDFEEFSLLYYILGIETDKFKGYNEISIKSYDSENNVYSKQYWDINDQQKVVVNLNLASDSLVRMISTEHDRNLELYFRASYITPENGIEVLHLPELEAKYLKVNPPPIVEPIIFVEASNEHKLPALYSAEDGSPWYVNAESKKLPHNQIIDEAKEVSENIEMVSNFFKENGGGAFEPEEINKWSKRSYDIAVRKLNKGEQIFNDGTKGVTNRFHRYTVSDIDGRYSKDVMMGVNRGKFKKGVTTKGINQLEAQASRGVAKVFKTVGELNPLWDAICDLADILTAAANRERPPLPFTPPFVSFEVNRMMADIDEWIVNSWNKFLFEAINNGKEELKNFLEDEGEINKKYNLGFKLINISDSIINSLLNKEILEYDRSCIDFETYLINKSHGKKDASILVQSIENNDKYCRITFEHYIHAIYVKDLIL